MWKRTSRNRKLTVISLALVFVILVGYVALVYYPENSRNSAYATSDEKAYSVDHTLVSANTNFAFDLFKELVAEDVKVYDPCIGTIDLWESGDTFRSP